MSHFRTCRSFGPRISLTERQEQKTIERVNAAGLTCFVDQCSSGSVYVCLGLPTWSQDINGEWFHDLDCGCGEDVAKIRLSGHDEGRRDDATHNAVGTKAECWRALNRWLDELITEHGERGRAIIDAGPSRNH
jgi:hypothetical protein